MKRALLCDRRSGGFGRRRASDLGRRPAQPRGARRCPRRHSAGGGISAGARSGMSAGGAIAAPRSGGNFAVSPGGAPRSAVSPGGAPRSGGKASPRAAALAGRTQLAGWRQLATSPPPSLPRTGHSLRVRRAVLLRLRHAVCVRGRRRLLADPAATGRIRPRLGLRVASRSWTSKPAGHLPGGFFARPIDGAQQPLIERKSAAGGIPDTAAGRNRWTL